MAGNDLLATMGNTKDRVYGEKIAQVETTTGDPNNLLRVQVRVFGVFTDQVPKEDLPWAEYKLHIGARVNDGTFRPAKIGDYVWVDFPYDGDTRRPRITGGVHYAPGSVPNFPHEVFGGAEAFVHKRTGDEPSPSAHAGGEDEISTQNGVTIERNKDGSYNVYQRTSGTELTITADGHLIFHVEGDIFRSATGSSKAAITGDETEEIGGKQSTKASGGIDHDGDGSGDLKGTVNGHHLCAFTRKPMMMVSQSVKSTK